MNNIKIAFDPKTGLYMGSWTDLRNSYNRKVLVDGNPIENPFQTSIIVFKEKPSKIEIVSSVRSLIGWEDVNDGNVISVQEYNLIMDELTSKGEFDDDEGWIFSEVEDHVNYLRFEKKYTKKFIDEDVVTELEIEIVEHPVSEIPEIVGEFYTGKGSIFDTICTYSINSAKLFRSRCEHYGLKKANSDSEKGLVYWLEERYDNFRFAKIGGSYCASDEKVREIRSSARGSYEDLKKIHEKNIEKIDSIIKLYLDKQNETKLTLVTVGNQITFLNSLLNSVSSLEVKKSSNLSRNSIIISIRENLENLSSINSK